MSLAQACGGHSLNFGDRRFSAIDARRRAAGSALTALLAEAGARGVRLRPKRLDEGAAVDGLQQANARSGIEVGVQGWLYGPLQAALHGLAVHGAPAASAAPVAQAAL